MTPAILFYLFASVLVMSAALTLFSRNPVHSVMWLILAFFNAAALMLMLGAEFLAMVLIIVYVGAVAVLFLFVVMMLDVDRAELRSGVTHYWPLAALVGALLLAEILIAAFSYEQGIAAISEPPRGPGPEQSNMEAFGGLLFTRYLVMVEVAGLILLVALMGAVLLTSRTRKRAKRQNVGDQVRRRPADSVRLERPPVAAGLEPGSIRDEHPKNGPP